MKRIRPWFLIFFVLALAPVCLAQDTESPLTIGWIMDSRAVGDGGYTMH